MIKQKELQEFRPRVRYKNGDDVTLEALQELLENYFNESAIPVSFYSDEIQLGGLFSLDFAPCLVLCHPDHKDDYFKFSIQVKRQGNLAYVSVNSFGSSRMMGNQDASDYLKDTLRFGSGAATSEKVGALLGAGARAILKGGMKVNKQKLEDEQDWYSFVSDAFEEVIA